MMFSCDFITVQSLDPVIDDGLRMILAKMSSDEERKTFLNWAKDRLEVAIPQVEGGLEDQAGHSAGKFQTFPQLPT